MDVLYLFRHSKHQDQEIRYSLRSVERHLPWIRKVWVFGDRPPFLTDNAALVEHVPHEYVARTGCFQTPVTNFFLLHFLASMIPELSFEFLRFSDDFILLDDLSEEQARKTRYVEDLDNVQHRGQGLWKDALWRTYDLLKKLGYPGYNFETHTPTWLTKKRVFEAYCEFKDFVTQDRWYGMLGPTAILNHAYRNEPMELTSLSDEGLKVGFYHHPPSYDQIAQQCRGKTFLNFDDNGFSPDMRRYLAERYSRPSKYEKDSRAPCGPWLRTRGKAPTEVPNRGPNKRAPNGRPNVAVSQRQPQERSRCVILVPVVGQVEPACDAGLSELQRRGYAVRGEFADCAIDQAKSQMATDALADGFQDTMWIDPDIGFDPEAVDRLRSHELPIVGGIYPRKGKRVLASHVLPETEKLVFGAAGGVTEILYGGGGFLLVRREVYEQVQQQLELPLCNERFQKPLIPFFQPLVLADEQGHWYLPEDYAFCQRARQCGFEIHADTTIRLQRYGSYGYSWEDAGSAPRRYQTYHFQLEKRKHGR